MEKKRFGNVSSGQKDLIIKFLKENPKLLNGKFDTTFTYKIAAKLWEELTLELNEKPGATKDWQHWRKTWHDMRTTAKNKSSMTMKNGENTLSATDYLICEMIGIDIGIPKDRKRKITPQKEKRLSFQKIYIQEKTNVTEEQTTEHKLQKSVNESASSSDKLLEIGEKKNLIKKSYYDKKLVILQRDVVAKERIANALEIMAGIN